MAKQFKNSYKKILISSSGSYSMWQPFIKLNIDDFFYAVSLEQKRDGTFSICPITISPYVEILSECMSLM